MTVARHIRAQLLAEQKKEEVRAPEVKFSNEEPTYEVANQEGEVTKEGILAMYAHCNVVELDSEALQFVEGMVKAKNVGKPVLPCTFGGSSYYGLCDIGTTVNVIPYRFYFSIQDELEHSQLEDMDMTIMLADKTLRVPMGVIKNVPITIGPYTYPIDFVVIDMPIDSHCPIIFGRTFLNTAGANIDCRKETISLKFGEEVMSFHFSKFTHKPIVEEEDFEERMPRLVSELKKQFAESEELEAEIVASLREVGLE